MIAVAERGKSLKTPDQIHNLIATIQADLTQLETEYRWMFGAAFGQSGRRLGGSPVPKGSHSDPTGAVAVGEDERREAWQSRVNLAGEQLEAAQEIIEKAMGMVTETYKSRHVVNLVSPPKSVVPTEMERLKAAQDRRRARGEDFGEG